MPGILNVENGGEVFSLAIARQLSQMGLRVRLGLSDSMARRLRTSERVSDRYGPADRLESLLRSTWADLDSRWELSGKIRFWITERKSKGVEVVTAHLVVLPSVSVVGASTASTPPETARKSYPSTPIFDQETITGAGANDPDLRRETTERVLRRAVQRFLAALPFEGALVGSAYKR
jgi:hypothetical protein